jgi:hypothetical protein
MDAASVLAPGACIVSASLDMFTNLASLPSAGADFTIGDVLIEGTIAYARVAGGVPGTDYQFRWKFTDSDGNVFQRTFLGLCSQTS